MTPASDPSSWTLPRLRIARDGTWFHENEEVTHTGILESLRSNLRVDGAGHYLEIGPVRVPVEVEDAPWVVERVENEGDGLALTLNDLSREPLRVDTLRFGPGAVPYCRVKGGAFDARLSRAAAYQLLQVAEEDEGGRAALVVGGVRYPLPTVARGDDPAPATPS